MYYKLVYRHVYISPNDLPEFPSAVLSSINDATTSTLSSTLQTENSSCLIWLKVNVSAQKYYSELPVAGLLFF